ncbi:MAG TPA: DUF4440 domain-containing protein [Terracidiphilus sp.]|nr:DUF4440 domain-containing protein [Terracidiphilus sp.]
MTKQDVFTATDPALLGVLEEIRSREPIFHNANFGATAAAFERSTAPEFWEVGASGRRYSRAFILRNAETFAAVKAERWEQSDHALRQLGPDTYLLTYTLKQTDRLTRRATIWQKTAEGWRILYHQGTVVTSEGDDEIPS